MSSFWKSPPFFLRLKLFSHFVSCTRVVFLETPSFSFGLLWFTLQWLKQVYTIVQFYFSLHECWEKTVNRIFIWDMMWENSSDIVLKEKKHALMVSDAALVALATNSSSREPQKRRFWTGATQTRFLGGAVGASRNIRLRGCSRDNG